MPTYIKQYIRQNEGHQPLGILVADKIDGKIHIGWSLTHKNDKYNKILGERIAANRLRDYNGTLVVPIRIYDQVQNFIGRVEFHYRTEKSEFLFSLEPGLPQYHPTK